MLGTRSRLKGVPRVRCTPVPLPWCGLLVLSTDVLSTRLRRAFAGTADLDEQLGGTPGEDRQKGQRDEQVREQPVRSRDRARGGRNEWLRLILQQDVAGK